MFKKDGDLKMRLSEFIINFAEEYSVHKLQDIEAGIFVKPIKDDIYLMRDAEVKTL